MPIYKVKLFYTAIEEMEIQATDPESAEDLAWENSNDTTALELEPDRAEVEMADTQYTDQQELEDGEKRNKI